MSVKPNPETEDETELETDAPDFTPHIPDSINSASGKLVYLYLETVSGATIDELNEGLNMKKISALSIIDTLSSNGLVEKNGDTYTTV